MNVVVLAPGESLTQEQCDATRGYFTIAVADAYKLAPWCDAICATDFAWWRARPDTLAMTCRRFSVHKKIEGVEQIEPNTHMGADSSSGVLGIEAARMLGATRILMLGFDNKGAHFFGAHKSPLKNTPDHRFKVFANQFFHLYGRLKLDGIKVLNCTPDTALNVFPKATLAEGLQWLMLSKSAA